MKSPFWFVVAGIIALGGIAGAVFQLLPRIDNLGSQLVQVVMPGSAVLKLDKPGTYTIFHEERSVVDGQYYNSREVEGLVLRIEGPTGASVPVNKPGTNSSYSFGSRSGTSIFEFTIDRPGSYRLTGTMRGRAGPKVVLAVGQGFVGEIFAMVGTTLAILFGSLGVAGGIVAAVVIQRRKAGKAVSTGVPQGHAGPTS